MAKRYGACMDVIESDHKPVRCKFHVQVAHVDRSVRRQEFGLVVRSNEKVRSILEQLRYVPETTVSTNIIRLQSQDTVILRITNKDVKEKAIFRIVCAGVCTVNEDEDESTYHSRGSYGFPRWLEVLFLFLNWKIVKLTALNPSHTAVSDHARPASLLAK
jgi:hypothetical protein